MGKERLCDELEKARVGMLGFKPASRSPLNPSQCQVTLQLQIQMMRRQFLFHRRVARVAKSINFGGNSSTASLAADVQRLNEAV